MLRMNLIRTVFFFFFYKPHLCVFISCSATLTLKEPGLLTPSHSRGGGGGGRFRPPPPSDLGRGATKNYEIRHVRRVSQYERADKIAILKIKAFLNYANLC